MLNIKKNKVKKSLIDDFVKISLISNFYCSIKKINTLNNVLLTEDLNLALKLKKTYLVLITQLKLNDHSFKILMCDLNKNNNLFEKEKRSNYSNLINTLEQTKKVLTQISIELDSKLKLLT